MENVNTPFGYNFEGSTVTVKLRFRPENYVKLKLTPHTSSMVGTRTTSTNYIIIEGKFNVYSQEYREFKNAIKIAQVL